MLGLRPCLVLSALFELHLAAALLLLLGLPAGHCLGPLLPHDQLSLPPRLRGLLLAHQGWFTQALEGPAEAVMTTYSRILKDPRHTDVTMFGAGPAERREFSDWNMCARRLSPTDDAILATLDLKGAFDPRGLGLGAAMRPLIAVKGIQSRVETEAPFNAA